MDKNIVEGIAKEVIAGYSKKAECNECNECKKKVLVIFMGVNRNLDDSLNAVKELARSNEVRIIATRAAASVIWGERIQNLTAASDIIIDDGSHDPLALSSWPDLVVIATLTLNGLSKIVNLITDTLQTNIVVNCLERQIPVIAARDSIFCSCYPEPASNSGIYRKVESYINDLKNLGITVTTSKNIVRESVSGAVSVSAVISAGAEGIADRLGVSAMQLAPYIDHTLLKANATQEEIGHLCEEARKYKFASVCINPAYVSMCSQLLSGSGVMVCTVIGFPLGATTSTVKAVEARNAIANGADEVDMVINIGAVKSGNYQLVLDDIKAVREATRGKTLKVIIETAYLSKDEKVRSCQLSKEAGADFVKTSTGFGPSGATAEDIKLIREVVGPSMGVKASGGIRSMEDASKMVAAGATRVGASASVAIVLGKDAGTSKY